MSSIIEPKILKGFRDILPSREIQKRRIQSILEETFISFGFVPIDTPVLEYSEVLLGKGGGETDKQVYRFNDHGGRDVSMRFDLTVPFARYIAAHRNELYLPFKRFHISKVWRGENTQRGRYREFYQCDFDIVGTDSVTSDFEILSLMYESMKNIGVPGFKINFSHRGIFNRFLAHIGLADHSVSILRAVDKIAKIGRDSVKELLVEFSTPDQAEQILSYIQPLNTNRETLENMTQLAGGDNPDTQRVKELLTSFEANGTIDSFLLNPAITRGLDYYTGIVYETFLDSLPEIGSVCSGGRYNNLASLYTKENLPGVGSSVGLDRLLAALEVIDPASLREGYTDVLIFMLDETLLPYYAVVAAEFRSRGFSVEIFPEAKKLQMQFSFAEKKGIPFGIFCGTKERDSRTVSVKNLSTRESLEEANIEDCIAFLKTKRM